MITVILVALSVIQLPDAPQALIRDSNFMHKVATNSVSGHEVVQTMSAKDGAKVRESRLNSEARAFAEVWQAKVLRPTISELAKATKWWGRNCSDGISKLFVRAWRSPVGEITWIDRGINAILYVRLSQPMFYVSVAEAEQDCEALLERILNLPSVPDDAVKFYLKSASGSSERPLFEGTVVRGQTTQVPTSDGSKTEKFVDPLKWHNYMYIATDGQNLIVRINFYDSDVETLKRVADPRTRFSP